MAEKNIKLKDGADVLYPITKIKNVVDDNEKPLSEILEGLGGSDAPTFEEIAPPQNINLEVGQTFNNQEVTFFLNWSGADTPEGSIYAEVNGETVLVAYWYFATDNPYISINDTTYYQSQGITEVVTTLNGTITNIDSHAYGAGHSIPLTNVFSKIELGGKVIEDVLVRTKDNTFGYTKIRNIIGGGGGSSEKVIHITNYSAVDRISFSMQGYSHFQILHGSTSGESGNCDLLGFVTRKDGVVNCGYFGHTNSTSGYLYDKSYLSKSYNEATDTITLNTADTPLYYYYDGDNGLDVYIRLLNVEEV